MLFTQTKLAGAFVIDLEPRADDRGFFARSFCREEFAAHGLATDYPQSNIAVNNLRGTLRGMHFRLPPLAEIKIVRCTRGAMLDVIVDLRPESPTFLQHVAVRLDPKSMRALYVPERFAHGYQSLEDDTETTYMMGRTYTPGDDLGLRYDDPRLGIVWPIPVSMISPRDRDYPLLDTAVTELRRQLAPA